jgi:protein-tyrosine-phosphatase
LLVEERILVLDADGRVGLACLQSLGAAGRAIHAGVRRLGSSTERSRWCARVHAQPPGAAVDDALAWLLELDSRFAFSLILPATEASLRWLRALPEDHPVRAKAALPSDAALDTALDKGRTLALARELGLPLPPSRALSQGKVAPEFSGRFPLVLKPVRSKVVIGGRLASLTVALVHDGEERRATLAAWLPFTAVLEQAWVPGRGIGVEVLYERGRMAWHFVHERLHEWPLTGGASTLRRAGGPEPELVEMTRRLLDRLDWHGVAMVEWRREESGSLHLMEINPRLWGSLPLTIAAGVDMPKGLLDLAHGRPLRPGSGWKIGLVARNMTDDLQWFIDNLRADHADPLLLTEPRWRATFGWLRALVGREVWDGWSMRDPRIAWTEIATLFAHRLKSLALRIDRRAALTRARQNHAAIVDGSASPRPAASVLFLCLGNICRSPFAAVVARDRLPGVAIESAGFLRHDGRPSPQHVVTTAHALGFDLSGARARRVTSQQVAAAGLIVCMDLTHLELMAAEFPEAMGRTTLLGLFDADAEPEIQDPFDLSPAATRAVFARMLKAVDALAASGVAGTAPR